MSQRARKEYIREVSARYALAGRTEKSRILDEFCQTGGYNRKYAVGLLRRPGATVCGPIKRPRAQVYGRQEREALAQLWKLSDCLCSKRLVPFLPELIVALERHGELCLCADVRAKLLTISASTADRLLAAERNVRPLRGLTTTKPGTLLRQQIQVRTQFGWDEQKPGYFETDLVAHCAESMAGDFLYTLTFTDIATGWTECQGLANRSQILVTAAIDRIRKMLPFPVLGIDCDNGTEFINHVLKGYCDKHKIELTRCRPYRKNDQCYVEQKNWSIVRHYMGYARYEGAQECSHLQSAYRWLRRYVNFFQPSLKLLAKDRDPDNPAKVRKRYDEAKTPYQRLLVSDALDEPARQDLATFYADLNPAQVREDLHTCIRRLDQARIARLKLRSATQLPEAPQA